jgi:hypothetical protein
MLSVSLNGANERMINECGVVDRLTIGRENQSAHRKCSTDDNTAMA